MKKYFLHIAIAGLCFSTTLIRAQQLPHYSQYMLNDYVMNPAIGGKNPYFIGMSANRYQWGGITDAPRTYILSCHGPMKYDHMGIGGQLFTDIVGPTRRTGFYMSYAYHAPLTDKIKLSFGLSAGILQFMVDGQKITLHDPGDLILTNSLQSVLTPDFGAGFYLYSDHWWVGASCLQIQQSKLKFFDYMSNTTSILTRTYYGMMGYRQPIGDDFIIEASALMKYVHPAPFQFDVSLRGIYKGKFWIGASYRNLDAYDLFAGFVMRENLMFGYAYDLTYTNLANYSTGTHELVIGIKFNEHGVKKGDGSTPQFN
ncbi:MAG: type IX secretion system membrane protein PorP/SprF [Bacteroidetes bacterium]|nr:type IX secretion system membrane protein PorP/SprF [Bacteroidota bacterium]